jgi:hypothetical protein
MIGFPNKTLMTSLRSSRPLIWIDYLCINQGNVEERTHQVALMSSIYSKAKTVIIWLGMPSNDSQLVIDFIKELGDNLLEKNIERLMTDLVPSKASYHAAQAVCERPCGRGCG